MEVILKRRTKFSRAILVPRYFLVSYDMLRRHNTMWASLKTAALLCMALIKS